MEDLGKGLNTKFHLKWFLNTDRSGESKSSLYTQILLRNDVFRILETSKRNDSSKFEILHETKPYSIISWGRNNKQNHTNYKILRTSQKLEGYSYEKS